MEKKRKLLELLRNLLRDIENDKLDPDTIIYLIDILENLENREKIDRELLKILFRGWILYGGFNS